MTCRSTPKSLTRRTTHTSDIASFDGDPIFDVTNPVLSGVEVHRQYLLRPDRRIAIDPKKSYPDPQRPPTSYLSHSRSFYFAMQSSSLFQPGEMEFLAMGSDAGKRIGVHLLHINANLPFQIPVTTGFGGALTRKRGNGFLTTTCTSNSTGTGAAALADPTSSKRSPICYHPTLRDPRCLFAPAKHRETKSLSPRPMSPCSTVY